VGFRINTIVKKLDNISERLDDIVNNGIEVEIVSGKVDKKGKPSEKPKSFMTNSQKVANLSLLRKQESIKR